MAFPTLMVPVGTPLALYDCKDTETTGQQPLRMHPFGPPMGVCVFTIQRSATAGHYGLAEAAEPELASLSVSPRAGVC